MLAVIPARAGSKRIPRKNFQSCAGEPLYLRACQQALRIPGVTRVVLSTDYLETLRLPEGVLRDPRPAHLAADEATAMELGRWLWQRLGAGHRGLLWLQPTSPLRRDEDISGALDFWGGRGAVVSACPGTGRYERSLAADGWLGPAGSGTQVCLNGAIYILDGATVESGEWILGARAWLMPVEHSLDIDTPEDWQEAIELLLRVPEVRP